MEIFIIIGVCVLSYELSDIFWRYCVLSGKKEDNLLSESLDEVEYEYSNSCSVEMGAKFDMRSLNSVFVPHSPTSKIHSISNNVE